jgi:hypothetical protein
MQYFLNHGGPCSKCHLLDNSFHSFSPHPLNRDHPFYLNQVAQDVTRCMMVAGDRAELRGLNLEGLRRNGFTDQEVFNFHILVSTLII